MGFLDLNIPYHESDRHATEASKSSLKTRRLKLVSKAMELGYSGVAYNYTIKGVMSESHRCSIPFFPLSSILLLAPSLSSSVNFHRQLLNVSVSSPFRQYTRLTVIVDTPSQAASLNNANPILKTYDVVAVCPVNQMAFELACQTAEVVHNAAVSGALRIVLGLRNRNEKVDIISIDFSDKLPFRLKQPMVKDAIERGVYFEIAYSTLILDAQVRRQMISNAKPLVDWTGGKNLIISSGAFSLTELRGPCDVANLSSLLGLTLERAKAAISKSCRSLIANALRRRNCFKEAIKVEVLPPGGQTNLDDWLEWDPISSGEGDLLLDDIEKSFSTSCKLSKTTKAINFASALNGLPSHGLQIKDMISIMPAAPEPPDIGKSSSTAQEFEVADPICTLSELPSSFSFPPKEDKFSLHNVQSKNQTSNGTYPELSFYLKCTLNNLTNAEEEGDHAVTDEKLESSDHVDHIEREANNLQSQSSAANSEENVFSLDNGATKSFAEDSEVVPSSDQCASANIPTPSKVLTFSAFHHEESWLSNIDSINLSTENVAVDGVLTETESRTNEELLSTSCDVPLHEGFLDREKLLEAKDSSVIIVDESPVKESYDQMTILTEYSAPKELPSASCDLTLQLDREIQMEIRDSAASVADKSPIKECYSQIQIENEYSVAKDEPMEEDTVGNQPQMKNHAGSSYKLLDESPSGRGRVKRRTSRQIFLFPFKGLLSPRPFKKKARKLKPYITL